MTMNVSNENDAPVSTTMYNVSSYMSGIWKSNGALDISNFTLVQEVSTSHGVNDFNMIYRYDPGIDGFSNILMIIATLMGIASL